MNTKINNYEMINKNIHEDEMKSIIDLDDKVISTISDDDFDIMLPFE